MLLKSRTGRLTHVSAVSRKRKPLASHSRRINASIGLLTKCHQPFNEDEVAQTKYKQQIKGSLQGVLVPLADGGDGVWRTKQTSDEQVDRCACRFQSAPNSSVIAMLLKSRAGRLAHECAVSRKIGIPSPVMKVGSIQAQVY